MYLIRNISTYIRTIKYRSRLSFSGHSITAMGSKQKQGREIRLFSGSPLPDTDRAQQARGGRLRMDRTKLLHVVQPSD